MREYKLFYRVPRWSYSDKGVTSKAKHVGAARPRLAVICTTRKGEETHCGIAAWGWGGVEALLGIEVCLGLANIVPILCESPDHTLRLSEDIVRNEQNEEAICEESKGEHLPD